MEALIPDGVSRDGAGAALVTRRVVTTGPESTGKTTLARALAVELGAALVPEAARLYAEELPVGGRQLTADDVAPIARLAISLSDAAMARAPALIVLDTDLLSTVVYARHYYGSCPSWIAAEARARRADLYLLCDLDLPWMADPMRDRPTDREAMFGLFVNALEEFECDVTRVQGAGETRVHAAREAVADRRWMARTGSGA